MNILAADISTLYSWSKMNTQWSDWHYLGFAINCQEWLAFGTNQTYSVKLKYVSEHTRPHKKIFDNRKICNMASMIFGYEVLVFYFALNFDIVTWCEVTMC